MKNQFNYILTCIFSTVYLAITFPAKSQSEINLDCFTLEDGMPNNQIQCVFQDSKGWMWFGTSQGLSRFDGYEFVNFIHDEQDSSSISGTLIRVIYEDKRGNLLVGTENGGLNVFNRELECFEHPYSNNPIFNERDISVNDIVEDKNGKLWLGTNKEIISIDLEGKLKEVKLQNEKEYVRVLQFDNSGMLWAGTNSGLYTINIETGDASEFPLPYNDGVDVDEIWEIYLDHDGSLWVGTYSHGAYKIEPVSEKITPIELLPKAGRTETVRAITAGDNGEYWIGTRGGLYSYDRVKKTSVHFKHNARNATSLVNNSVLDIFDDQKGGVWIGTRGGLNLLAKSRQVFHNYEALPSDKTSKYLNCGIVHAFWVDKDDKIWIGTEDGGINIYDPKTNTYKYLTSDPKKPNTTISKNCIKAFQYDGNGNLWIGTFRGGVNVLNLKTGKITYYTHEPEKNESLSNNKVWDFLLDDDGYIWLATSKGVDKFDPSNKKFIHYPQLADNAHVNWIEKDSKGNIWLGTTEEIVVCNLRKNEVKRFNEHSRAFLEDAQGQVWIATLDKGFAQYSKEKGPVCYYTTQNGLANNQALNILEDNERNLWISTSNGLSKFNPTTKTFLNLSKEDGLLNNQFTYGAGYKKDNGELILGGISGFNIFDPSKVRPDNNDYPIVLTGFRVFNRRVEVGTEKKSILKKSISETQHITLEYGQNVFTVEYAALNYFKSKGNLYSYYLEGFDKNWSEPSLNRAATYTNLNPNDYVLHIKRVVAGDTSNNQLQVRITVMPPYWKTFWFRLIIISIIGILVYLLIQFFIYREKIKNEVVIARMNARKQREVDMMKLKFFTNISHEIRTPLTLILTPLEKLVSNELNPNETRTHLQLMYKNSKQLNRLIDQLLDFRKLESGNLKLELMQGDIVRFVAGLVNSFTGYAEEKKIDLKFKSLKDNLIAYFDSDKIEKILNNLLSNAFKYTAEGGKVRVNLSLVFDANEEDLSEENVDGEFIEISVKDTGTGISKANTDKIFNRFFQANEKEVHTGTGIGLSYVKELIKLHHGKIFVESKQGKGTKFTVRIPYSKGGELEQQAVELRANKTLPYKKGKEQETQSSNLTSSRIMLIVEDNPDVRMLICSHFSSYYKIIEANNGKEGWRIALDTLPDIVISDVLMPELNGYELCEKIKKDERTSHIPVLLLTALHSKEHEINGLSSGADDYITKPFDLGILQTKVNNMLSIRKALKEKYSEEITLQPKNIVISSPDEKFLHKAVECVEKNISDAELDIEKFSKEVGVSRMQLYRKLHALTDMTVKEFIRSIRLKRATQLLIQEKVSVSEIAYAVGFKDLSHFRKCFRQAYGMSATEYKEKNKGNEVYKK